MTKNKETYHKHVTIIIRDCPQCGNCNKEKDPSVYSYNEWEIKNCSHCGFVYLENCPEYDALKTKLAWEKTSQAEKRFKKIREPVKQVFSDALKTFRRKAFKRDKLSRLTKKHFHAGNVLDIGCAKAGLLAGQPSQYVPYGIEISESLAKTANENIGHRGGHVVHADAVGGIKLFDDDFFTGVIMSAFLEHETAPMDLLKASYRVCANNGKVIIKVPNYACINRKVRKNLWCGFRYPDHVNYFTPASLKQMCLDAGFSICQFGLRDKHPLSDNMWIVLEKSS